ncbi:Protein of unknown function (DUF997) [Moritella viscosa]|nr:Protein of unknown function (DUF997) [Moritella viscosa]
MSYFFTMGGGVMPNTHWQASAMPRWYAFSCFSLHLLLAR